MRSLAQRRRVEVRLPAQLCDPTGDLVRVALLLSRMLFELGGDLWSVQTSRRKVVPLVAQYAHQFGSKRLVAHVDHPSQVGAVRPCDRTAFYMVASILA